MKADAYHQCLLPLEEACRLAETGWFCLRNPLIGPGTGRSPVGRLVWKMSVLIRHAALVVRCYAARSHAHILVREFSTWPLLLVFPFLLPLRRKLFFLIHHNLQWAARRPVERAGFLTLARMGARFVLLETREIGGPAGSVFSFPDMPAVPLPVAPLTPGRKNPDRPVIGVAGYIRPEKGTGNLLELLVRQFPGYDIVLGSADPANVSAVPGSVQVENTASDDDYLRMLARCDVIVQNGAPDRYFYRVSGPVADAAACGTAVVVPDFPLLRHQVSFPVPIGEVFRSVDELPRAVQTAVASARAGRYDFNAYCAARSPQALAGHLDRFSRSSHG